MATLLDFSRPHVLRNEDEYDAAVNEIDELLDANVQAGSEEYDRLEFLSVLVEVYENEHHPAGDVTPQQLIDFMLEQKGKTRSELAEWMGGRSRLSEFYSGKRPLSLGQIKKLNAELGIPTDLLIEAAE